MKTICVDACLVVKWLTPEEGSDQALALLHRWIKEDVRLVAPSLLDYEVGSVLQQKVVRGLLRHQDLFPAIELYEGLGISLFHVTRLVFQCLAVADTLAQSTIYDVSYLTTAKQQDADLVTTDKRFYEAAHPLFGRVKFYKNIN